MSRPKQNLTPAQRKAYDARMKQLRQQQQRKTPIKQLGKAPPMTAAQKREILRKQRLARRKAIQTQRQKVESAKTPLDKRQARTTLKAMRVDGRLQRATRRGNTEKAKKLETKIEKLAKRNQRLRNKQIAKKLGLPKPPPRPTRLTGATRRYVKVRARGRG